ncbi:hypothetical protein GCM10027172_13180 [Halomonas garicola]
MSMVTLRPRASRIAASEAEAMPLPREDTTPPVTKIYRVMENLSKRDQKARQKATPGWDDRIADSGKRLNLPRGLNPPGCAVNRSARGAVNPSLDATYAI